MKYIFSILLSLVCWTATASAEVNRFIVDGIYYNILSSTEKTVEVTYDWNQVTAKRKYYSGSVVIPATVTYGGVQYSVTSIGGGAFSGCSGLTSVTIPEGVTSIGSNAFYNCSGLTSITIPESVTRIGGYAFERCSGLTTITIPEGVTSIGVAAFYNCSNLKTVNYNAINCQLDKSEHPLFEGCTSLELNIGKNVQSIFDNAFSGCSGLTSITISEGVTSIGKRAFSGCSGLTTITIPEGVTSIGENAFYRCIGLTSVTIPESVTSIGGCAFNGCSKLKIVFYNAINCTDEGGWNYPVFKNCELFSLCIKGEKVKNIPKSLISGVEMVNGGSVVGDFVITNGTGLAAYIGSATDVVIPEYITSIGNSAFCYCSGLTSITIPASVTSIGDYAFRGCSGLTSITIPESVTSIGDYAFRGCSGLTTITIPESVTSIGGYAFSGCSGLTSITIPESVTSIGGYAFSGCSGLTSITIPEGVTSIGGSAFSGCSGLTSITIPEGVTSIGDYAFKGCSGLTSITIPEGVTSIGDHAFGDCRGLTSITIPESVTSIGVVPFSGCSGLTTVNYNAVNCEPAEYGGQILSETSIKELNIGENVQRIPNDAFPRCIGLTSVTIPESVTSIGGGAFYYCRGLTSITIPEGVTSIGYQAFYGCSGLTSITIPESVTSIEGMAFYGCEALKDVYYEGTQEEWDAIKFGFNYSYLLYYGATLHFVEKDLLEVEQQGNGAVITWPAVENADKYELTVMRNGEVLETIVFDKNGLVITDGGKKADAIGKALSHELYNLVSGRYTCLLKAVDKAGSALKEGFYEFEISGTPTGVKTPKATPHRTGIYDLMGRSLSAPQRGINIINGKKVLVK